MRRLALQGPARRFLVRLHRWSGCVLLVMLTVAGLTGSVLAFREPLDRALNPSLHLVQPATTRLPLDRVLAIVEARYQDARVGTVTLPRRDDESLIAYLSGRPRPSGRTIRPTVSEVFVDPYLGAILGHRLAGKVSLDRAYLIPLLVRLHYTLLLGPWGASAMGVAAVGWLLTTLVGLALAWPAGWRTVAGWTSAIAVRRAQGAFVATYDVHRVLGLMLMPAWLVLASTSIYLAFPAAIRSAVAVASSLPALPASTSPAIVEPSISPEAAMDRARTAVPGARVFGFTRDFANSRYSVRLVLPSDVNPVGNSQVYVDFATGRVVAVRRSDQGTAGQRFLNWQFPLHSGEAFGPAGEAAVAVCGLALAGLGLSGGYLWLRGQRARRSHTRTSKEHVQ